MARRNCCSVDLPDSLAPTTRTAPVLNANRRSTKRPKPRMNASTSRMQTSASRGTPAEGVQPEVQGESHDLLVRRRHRAQPVAEGTDELAAHGPLLCERVEVVL